jgi:hypothetical protein
MARFARSAPTWVAVALALAAGPAFAEIMAFKADLSGASEVPPTTSQGTGTLAATYERLLSNYLAIKC